MSTLGWILVVLGIAATLGIGALHIGDLIGISAAADAADDENHDDGPDAAADGSDLTG